MMIILILKDNIILIMQIFYFFKILSIIEALIKVQIINGVIHHHSFLIIYDKKY